MILKTGLPLDWSAHREAVIVRTRYGLASGIDDSTQSFRQRAQRDQASIASGLAAFSCMILKRQNGVVQTT